jgi:hypothetical protein
MKRIAQLALGALALTSVARTVAAQDTTMAMEESKPFFGKPVFVIMPSAVIAPVFSGSGDGDAGDTKAYFNARFMTVLPTKLEWLQGVAGVQWQPNFPRNAAGQRQNTPGVFYGAIIPFVPLNKATGGWLNLSLDPLGLYAAGAGGSPDENAFGHVFVLEGAAVVPFGAKMMSQAPFFSNLSAFFLLDQQLSSLPEDANGDKDYWSPVALAGIIIPIGG